MGTEHQLPASLKETGDFKATLNEHAITAFTNPQRKIPLVNDKFRNIFKHSGELPGQDHWIITSNSQIKELIRDRGAITHGKVFAKAG
jgi:hypothetical protein